MSGTDWLPSNDKLDDLGAGGGYLSGSPVALCSPSGEHTVRSTLFINHTPGQ